MKECSRAFLTVIFFIILNFCIFLLSSCAHDIIDYASVEQIVYSQHMQPIFNKNCLASGCHNSRDRANGLDLTSWESLIRGSDYGAVIISGQAEHSHLVEHLEGEAEPRMPLHRQPLPKAQINLIARWVEEGARNDAGQRPYENLTKKVYVSNQGADLIAVISMEHHLVTRLLPVGDSPVLDVPHNLFVDRQKQFLYVANQQSNNLSVIRVSDNQVVATIESPAFANPHGIAFTPDGRSAYVTNENLSGDYNPHHPTEHGGNHGNVVVIDTATNQVIKTIEVEVDPTGVAVVER